MCVITERLKERFCKDFNLPIKVFCEPYFTERLTLFDKYYGCLAKYNRFVDLVNRLGGEQAYFEYYNKVKDLAITYLNDNEAMKYFAQQEDMSKYIPKNTGFPKRDIYHADNHGKYFVSFDMKRGNFTALSHYNSEIVGGAKTYEDFLAMFTDEPHMLESKYIRQVIFGNVNPRRQVTYEQYLMDIVLNNVLTYCNKEDIVYFSTDEIVVKLDENYTKKLDNIHATVEESCKQGINIRSEVFQLYRIDGVSGYVKKILDGEEKFVIKCVDSLFMPMFLRKLYGEEIMHNDYVFLHDGMLAQLIDVPDFNISF